MVKLIQRFSYDVIPLFQILSRRDEEAERRSLAASAASAASGVEHPSVKVGRSSLVKYKANNRNKVRY